LIWYLTQKKYIPVYIGRVSSLILEISLVEIKGKMHKLPMKLIIDLKHSSSKENQYLFQYEIHIIAISSVFDVIFFVIYRYMLNCM
jgi:hypothetical protein